MQRHLNIIAPRNSTARGIKDILPFVQIYFCIPNMSAKPGSLQKHIVVASGTSNYTHIVQARIVQHDKKINGKAKVHYKDGRQHRSCRYKIHDTANESRKPNQLVLRKYLQFRRQCILQTIKMREEQKDSHTHLLVQQDREENDWLKAESTSNNYIAYRANSFIKVVKISTYVGRTYRRLMKTGQF